MTTSFTVLNIPVPKCAQALAIAPPTCPPCQADTSVLEHVAALGKLFKKSKAEILYEKELASGLSDIVIILLRPYVQNYHASFHSIVENSPTLRWLDAVIRFCTKGTRSIHNVTVVNAYPMQPDENETGMDEACHQFVARVLQSKKPKVIIQCHRDPYNNEWMARFNFGASGYELTTSEVPIDEGHTSTFIQSFHPSCAVNKTDCRPEYPALLIHHFLVAFRALNGHVEVPDYVEDIRVLCLKKGQRREKPIWQYWEAAAYIEGAFYEPYTGIETSQYQRFADDTPVEDLRRRLGCVDMMFSALTSLAKGQCAPGALALAKTITFYWKAHFTNCPIFNQVMSLLEAQGIQQRGWFGSRTRSARQIQDSAKLSFKGLWINNAGDRYLSHKVFEVISTANTYLRASTIFELGTTINLANSATCCEIMANESVDPKWLMRTKYFKEIQNIMR